MWQEPVLSYAVNATVLGVSVNSSANSANLGVVRYLIIAVLQTFYRVGDSVV